ncbi:MAG: dicarboxylate/amino acid:cation symporter [Rikenellaceae bacterium]
MRKTAPYIKIMAGMGVGVIIGLIASHMGYREVISHWITPFGDIFIRLLKLIAIPLVLVSLIKGVGSLQDINKLATIGGKTAALYIASTLLAITLGVALVMTIRPGDMVSDEISQSLYTPLSGSMEQSLAHIESAESLSPLQPLVDIVPENAIKALGDNASMLQVILLALLIGVATVLVGGKSSRPFMEFISSLDAIIIKCIDIVMGFAPIGVMALIAGVVSSSSGDGSLLWALGLYILTVVLGLMLLMVIVYPTIISLTTNIGYVEFLRAMFPVQLMGFSTSSSAATLATTMKMSHEVLHLPKNITSFTLPLGVTINMDGTSIYQAILVIFIAQVMGIDLTTSQLLTIIATTTLSSIGTPGVPGGSIVVSMMVLTAAGIPVEGLALVMGVDRPLDMLRTSVNVTGDVAVSAIVAKSTKLEEQE